MTATTLSFHGDDAWKQLSHVVQAGTSSAGPNRAEGWFVDGEVRGEWHRKC